MLVFLIGIASAFFKIQPFGLPEPFVLSYDFSKSPLNSFAEYRSDIDVAVEFALQKLRSINSKDSIRVTSKHFSSHSSTTHVYFVQTHDSLDIANCIGNIHVKHGSVVSFYFNYAPADYTQSNLIVQRDSSSAKYSLFSFLDQIGYPIPIESIETQESGNDVLVFAIPIHKTTGLRVELVQVPMQMKLAFNGTLVPVWDTVVDFGDAFFNVLVHGDEIYSLVDWVSRSEESTYNVFPLGINDPSDGERKIVHGPLSSYASPLGWHGYLEKGKYVNSTKTFGNNVYAQENLDGGWSWENKQRPDGGKELVFDFGVDFTKDPITYVDAAVVNLFYWNNAIHDLFYEYGFNEESGNFQDDNLKRGGLGGDGVIANAQDGSGYNNANFATPPDGQRPRMRMYVWSVTQPMRDGDLEGGIIVHEYAHGISTRLTGGPSNSGCLGWGEAGGMGEGWGDFFATILRMTPLSRRTDDFSMGEYSNGGNGIRRYKYSTSNVTNPSLYSFIQKPGYWGVHAKGEVWAEILYEVYWDLVDAHGFNPDWFDTPFSRSHSSPKDTYVEFRTGKKLPRTGIYRTSRFSTADQFEHGGNILALQLVVDGLKFQPCTPSFVDARDAIITAEAVLTEGKNNCLLWKAFARRGLGIGAVEGGVDGFGVPADCE